MDAQTNKYEILVDRYVRLRDAKAKLKKKFDTDAGKIEDVMDKIEAALLADFGQDGIESARTTSGTAYKSEQSRVSIADWDAFVTFLKDAEAYHMLNHSVSKPAVEQYKTEHNDLPPGVNWTSEIVINVRRS